MRRSIATIAMLVMVHIPLGCGGGSGAGRGGGGDLATFADSASYALGMNMAASVQRAGAEVEVEQIVHGLRDAMNDRPAVLSDGDAQQLIQRLASEARTHQQSRMAEMAQRNAEEGRAFLAENGAREGVTTTATGLQYEVLTRGTGQRPEPTDVVQVRYRGTFIDGTEFDATPPSSEGISFALNEVIPGWTEGVGLMTVGSKYRFCIPSDLAYGPNGYAPDIGPDATLIFEVELLAIK